MNKIKNLEKIEALLLDITRKWFDTSVLLMDIVEEEKISVSNMRFIFKLCINLWIKKTFKEIMELNN
jgi:hypothetical protein